MPTDNTSTTTAKVALVTGGSRGLGRSTVLHLAHRGVQSIFTYNANRDAAQSVVASAAEAGAKSIALQLNMGNLTTFESFLKMSEMPLAS